MNFEIILIEDEAKILIFSVSKELSNARKNKRKIIQKHSNSITEHKILKVSDTF